MRFWDRLKWCVIGGAGYALDGICSSWYRPTQEDNMAKNNIRSVRFSER